MRPAPALLGFALVLAAAAPARPGDDVPVVRVAFPDGSGVAVELADTSAARTIGLRYRTAVPAGWGMLFDYGVEQPVTLWMQDCPVPVSVAFLDRTGRVLGVEDLRPLDETVRRRSRGAARYALAVGQGSLAPHGVGRGARLELLRRPLLTGEARPRMPVEGPLVLPAGRPGPDREAVGDGFSADLGGTGKGGGGP